MDGRLAVANRVINVRMIAVARKVISPESFKPLMYTGIMPITYNFSPPAESVRKMAINIINTNGVRRALSTNKRGSRLRRVNKNATATAIPRPAGFFKAEQIKIKMISSSILLRISQLWITEWWL